jgi:hypothetical protein
MKAPTRTDDDSGERKRSDITAVRQGKIFEGALHMESLKRRGDSLSATLGATPCGNAKHAYADNWLMQSRFRRVERLEMFSPLYSGAPSRYTGMSRVEKTELSAPFNPTVRRQGNTARNAA